MGKGHAWVTTDDPQRRARELSDAHDQFLKSGSATGLRPLVTQSWARSLQSGLDPEGALAPVELVDDELEEWRRYHPLAPVMPVIRKLLVDDAVDAGLIVAVSDAVGRLLWVEGSAEARALAERIHFVEGAAWAEAHAGTNAPGTALAVEQPVQIFAAEHLARRVMPWSCAAAPIRDPDSGVILGALDITGGDEVAAPATLSLVRATVAAVEGELRVRSLTAGGSADEYDDQQASGWALRVLGAPYATLHRPDGSRRLGQRHGELLMLLCAHPEGMTGEQLSLALYEQDSASVSVRAELSRLRPLMEPLRLDARPYRLRSRVRTDVDDVRRLLARGRLGAAVSAYRGPLLPTSTAPGILALRESLHEELRAALITGRDPDALMRFAAADHGRLDWQVWSAARSALPPRSPRQTQVESHLAFLDDELGAS